MSIGIINFERPSNDYLANL
jgi:26S proteasome regulatory subunit N2